MLWDGELSLSYTRGMPNTCSVHTTRTTAGSVTGSVGTVVPPDRGTFVTPCTGNSPPTVRPWFLILLVCFCLVSAHCETNAMLKVVGLGVGGLAVLSFYYTSTSVSFKHWLQPQVSSAAFITDGCRNNAWCRMPGWHISILGLDWLHVVDLTLAPELAASVPCIVDSGFWTYDM